MNPKHLAIRKPAPKRPIDTISLWPNWRKRSQAMWLGGCSVYGWIITIPMGSEIGYVNVGRGLTQRQVERALRLAVERLRR